MYHIYGLVVNYSISNTIVLEIPQFTTKTAIWSFCDKHEITQVIPHYWLFVQRIHQSSDMRGQVRYAKLIFFFVLCDLIVVHQTVDWLVKLDASPLIWLTSIRNTWDWLKINDGQPSNCNQTEFLIYHTAILRPEQNGCHVADDILKCI